jgi:hypothetical protein
MPDLDIDETLSLPYLTSDEKKIMSMDECGLLIFVFILSVFFLIFFSVFLKELNMLDNEGGGGGMLFLLTV